MTDKKDLDMDAIIKMVGSSGKKLDRTKHVSEISDCLKTLGSNDMRVGQAFENIRSKYGNDLFNIENDKLLELFKDFMSPTDK